MQNPILHVYDNAPNAPPAPTGIAQYFKSAYEVDSVHEVLSAYPNNWPRGLQNCLINSLNKIPFRFFICDDSGSVS